MIGERVRIIPHDYMRVDENGKHPPDLSHMHYGKTGVVLTEPDVLGSVYVALDDFWNVNRPEIKNRFYYAVSELEVIT